MLLTTRAIGTWGLIIYSTHDCDPGCDWFKWHWPLQQDFNIVFYFLSITYLKNNVQTLWHKKNTCTCPNQISIYLNQFRRKDNVVVLDVIIISLIQRRYQVSIQFDTKFSVSMATNETTPFCVDIIFQWNNVHSRVGEVGGCVGAWLCQGGPRNHPSLLKIDGPARERSMEACTNRLEGYTRLKRNSM